MDPPLRSRFQAMSVAPLSLDQKLGSLTREYSELAQNNNELAGKLVKFAETLRIVSNSTPKFAKRLPYFPVSLISLSLSLSLSLAKLSPYFLVGLLSLSLSLSLSYALSLCVCVCIHMSLSLCVSLITLLVSDVVQVTVL